MENHFAIVRFTPEAFMETSESATENLKATAGVRLDFPERFDSELSPKLGVLYHASKKTNLDKYEYYIGSRAPGTNFRFGMTFRH